VVAQHSGVAAGPAVAAVGTHCTVLADLDLGLSVGFAVDSHFVAAALDSCPESQSLAQSLNTEVAAELLVGSCYIANAVVLVAVVADRLVHTAAHYTEVEAAWLVLIQMTWADPVCKVWMAVEGQGSLVAYPSSTEQAWLHHSC
jgi:hypothetical protein